jgi:flagellar assembly protein FliH
LNALLTALGKRVPAAEQDWISPAGGGGPSAGEEPWIWPAMAALQAEKRRTDPGSGREPRPASSGAGLAYLYFDRPAPAPAPAPEPEVIEPTFSLAEVEAARAEGIEEGRRAAAADAQEADHAAIRQTLNALATQLAGAKDMLEERAEQSATAIAQLLLHCMGAVMPRLSERYGEAELKSLVRAILPGLFQEPAATVRLNPRHAAAISDEIEQFDPDMAARIRVLPTAAIPPGDLRIAWSNGGATRNGAALWAQVLETLALADLAPVAPVETRELEHAG